MCIFNERKRIISGWTITYKKISNKISKSAMDKTKVYNILSYKNKKNIDIFIMLVNYRQFDWVKIQ